ncbi:MAG TPA: hypothetical protein VIL42_10540 [Sphingomicrobium sp.]|jgi:hypothetical protein
MAADLLALAERCEQATGPDRDLDAEIAERAYGWRPAPCPADGKGENAGEVLTPDGQPFKVNGEHWRYPPLGKVHRAYHCPEYTRDCRDPAFPRDAIRQQTAAALRVRAAQAGER